MKNDLLENVSTGQRFALERMASNHATVMKLNDSIGQRAAVMASASGAVAGISAIAHLVRGESSAGFVGSALLIAAGFAGARVVMAAASIYQAARTAIPFRPIENDFEYFVAFNDPESEANKSDRSEEAAKRRNDDDIRRTYERAFGDLATALMAVMKRNEEQGARLDVASRSLRLQVFLMACAPAGPIVDWLFLACWRVITSG